MVDGTARCWGDNGGGQVGDGTLTQRNSPTLVLVAPGGAPVTGVAEIESGNSWNCLRKTDGTAWCWGYGYDGRLGDGNGAIHTRSSPSPVIVSSGGPSLTGVASLGLAAGSACARKTDGTVVCWGYNTEGEMGNGTTATPQLFPSPVLVSAGGSALSGFIDVVGGNNAYWGGFHFCGLKSDGTVLCWGVNNFGEIGTRNTVTPQATPFVVTW